MKAILSSLPKSLVIGNFPSVGGGSSNLLKTPFAGTSLCSRLLNDVIAFE